MSSKTFSAFRAHFRSAPQTVSLPSSCPPELFLSFGGGYNNHFVTNLKYWCNTNFQRYSKRDYQMIEASRAGCLFRIFSLMALSAKPDDMLDRVFHRRCTQMTGRPSQWLSTCEAYFAWAKSLPLEAVWLVHPRRRKDMPRGKGLEGT
jgi:hypothetical protein